VLFSNYGMEKHCICQSLFSYNLLTINFFFARWHIGSHLYVLFRNSFSQLVGEEFLKFFDFGGDALDVALRRFVQHLTPISEPQDCDQMLSHFAHRYHSCNSSQYKSAGNITTDICLAYYFLAVHFSYWLNVKSILPCDAMLAWVLAVSPSVTSRCSTKTGSRKQSHMIARDSSSVMPKILEKFKRGHSQQGCQIQVG